jgi:hypothetical protein
MSKKLAILATVLMMVLTTVAPALAQTSVVATGVLEKPEVTSYMYGTHAITDEASGTRYALRSESVGLDAYVGQRVIVYGLPAPGYENGQVEGGPLLLDVASVEPAPSVGDSALDPPPAIESCGADCGADIGEEADEEVGDGSDGTGGKDAYDAALDASRSSGDDGVAFASEAEEIGGTGTNDYSWVAAEEEVTAGEEIAASDTEGGTKAELSGAGEAGDGPDKGEDAGAEPVSERDAAVASGLRSTGSSPILALSTGALLLVVGVFVARKTFWG